MAPEPGETCKHCGTAIRVVDDYQVPINGGSKIHHYRCGSWIHAYPTEREERQSDRCRIQQLTNELAFQRQKAYMRNDITSADRISKLIGAKLPSVHEGEAK